MEEEQWSQRFARRLEEEDEYDDYGGDEYDVDLDDNPSVFNIGNKITYEVSFQQFLSILNNFIHKILLVGVLSSTFFRKTVIPPLFLTILYSM